MASEPLNGQNQPVPLSDQDETKLVKELEERFLYFEEALKTIRQNMSRWWRLYLGERKDNRKQNEQWRSNTWLGDPFHQTQTGVAVLLSILNAIDPSISAEGVGAEDLWKGEAFTRAMDYFLRMNRWSYSQEMLLTKASIQGWTVVETRWREIKFNMMMRPDRNTRVQYDETVNGLLKSGVPSPPNPQQDPQGYQMWIEQAAVGAPSLPQLAAAMAPAEQEIIQYRGPWFARNSDFDYYFDPNTEDWTRHELFIKRVVKPWNWIEKNPDFDQAKVKACHRGAGDTNRVSTWEKEINAKAGLSYNENDPLWKDAGEILECWRIFDERPYACVLNRTKIVNRSMAHPYWHRQLPHNPIRNTPFEGRAFGLSDYAQLEKAFYDRLKLRDLLLDGLVLSVLPVFMKSRTLGLPDVQKSLSPGLVLDVNDVNGWKKAWESMPGFAELVQITQIILSDQNLMLATGENVRGQQATIGRVSATEAQSRLTQALVRWAQKAIRIEEEFNPIIPQALALVYQKWPASDPRMMELRKRMIGADQQDPWMDKDLSRDTFAEAINMNIKFRGASRTQDRQLQAQQLKDFIQLGASIQVAPGIPALLGSEVRAGLRKIIQITGVKGAAEIVSEAGDALVMEGVKTAQMSVQMAVLQGQQALQAAMQPPQAPAPPPQKIQYGQAPPDVQRAMEQAAGLPPSQMDPRTPPQPQPAPEEVQSA
jgi:hypothetical protein